MVPNVADSQHRSAVEFLLDRQVHSCHCGVCMVPTKALTPGGLNATAQSLEVRVDGVETLVDIERC